MHIKGGKLKNILLRADCTYSRMLSKCIKMKKLDFYIADSRRAEVWNGDIIGCW